MKKNKEKIMEDKQDLMDFTEAMDFVKNKQEDIKKVGIILLSVFGITLIFTITHFLKGIPFFSDVFVLIGCIYSLYFSNKYLLLASERTKLFATMVNQKNKITGKTK